MAFEYFRKTWGHMNFDNHCMPTDLEWLVCRDKPNAVVHVFPVVGAEVINSGLVLQITYNTFVTSSYGREYASPLGCFTTLGELPKSVFLTSHFRGFHDDVIKWRHFPRYWPFLRGIHRSTVNSPHKGQWRGALMFSLICVWINGWVNNREAGDLRRYHSHYDVIVMKKHTSLCGVVCIRN